MEPFEPYYPPKSATALTELQSSDFKDKKKGDQSENEIP
jgi:hypothetical protein